MNESDISHREPGHYNYVYVTLGQNYSSNGHQELPCRSPGRCSFTSHVPTSAADTGGCLSRQNSASNFWGPVQRQECVCMCVHLGV